MKESCTLGVQRQVFGAVWTLEHLRVLDLLHQLLQEVLPGCVSVQEAAGKCGPSVVCEPVQKVNVLRAGLKRPRHHTKFWVGPWSPHLTLRVCVGSKSGLLTSSTPAARA